VLAHADSEINDDATSPAPGGPPALEEPTRRGQSIRSRIERIPNRSRAEFGSTVSAMEKLLGELEHSEFSSIATPHGTWVCEWCQPMVVEITQQHRARMRQLNGLTGGESDALVRAEEGWWLLDLEERRERQSDTLTGLLRLVHDSTLDVLASALEPVRHLHGRDQRGSSTLSEAVEILQAMASSRTPRHARSHSQDEA